MTSRSGQKCIHCNKSNIRNMLRHLNHCVSFQTQAAPSKRVKITANSSICTRREIIKECGSSVHNIRNEEVSIDEEHDNHFDSLDEPLQLYEERASTSESITMDVQHTTACRKSLMIESCIDYSKDDKLTSKQHMFEMDILRFCNKVDAPLYAYDELMTIMKKHNTLHNIAPGKTNSRASLIANIKNNHKFLQQMEPIIKNVNLDGGNVVEVVTFDFMAMLTSLLNDKKCMQDDNLTFPGNCPYNKPIETGVRGEFHTGQWYRDVWNERWEKQGDFVLGIIFFIDKTFTDVYGRLSLLPIQFTLSIFNINTRTKFHAWRPLGYINDMKAINELSSSDIRSDLRSERNLNNFHAVLKVVLESFKKTQEDGPISYRLNFRSDSYYLNLIPIVGPIIGDSEEHDTLVGRYGCYNKVQRICRYCDCSFEDSDNPHVNYVYTEREDITGLMTNNNIEQGRELLNNISYHYLNNAFDGLDFGNDKRGLHGLCPAEILHCVRLGLFKMSVQCFFKMMQPRFKTEMDKLLNVMSKQFSHQSDRDVPRTSFKFVISDLTKITAGEWTGILLLLTSALLTRCGRQIWRDAGNTDSVKNEFIKLFERLLIIEKWLQDTDGYKLEELEDVKQKMLKFLEQYKKICRRKEGNEMRILKYHMMTHVVDDIIRLGLPQNVNGGPCESNFIPQKREAKRTQRRADTFLKQIASRIHENLVIAHAMEEDIFADDNITLKNTENIPVGGSRFIIQLDSLKKIPEITWKRNRVEKQSYDKDLIKFIFESLSMEENDTIHCFTEHKVNGRIFRADPSYRGQESWNDWVTVVWQKEDDIQVLILARIHFFIDCTEKIYNPPKFISNMVVEGGQIYAVISSLKEEQPTARGVSKLFLQGNIYKEQDELMYYVVSVDTMDENALVLHDVEENNMFLDEDTVLIMRPCDTWKEGISLIDEF